MNLAIFQSLFAKCFIPFILSSAKGMSFPAEVEKIRAILALEFYLTLNNKSLKKIVQEQTESKELLNITKYCIALEFVHTYSLVHDDLPCMDNDILRR